MEERLLKPAEIAEILQVSRALAYSLLQRGEIPAIRIGSVVRVRRIDLEQYINEKAHQKNRDKVEFEDSTTSILDR
ncbi:MAG TPA: helix-turn-helix domain-containing protein [Anaerolineales bacterium]|nr:helix-turn-helix domain-containing protein [Anaerolineales bacterium]